MLKIAQFCGHTSFGMLQVTGNKPSTFDKVTFDNPICGSYRNQRCIKQETWTSNILNTGNQWVWSAVVTVRLHSQHKKQTEIF